MGRRNNKTRIIIKKKKHTLVAAINCCATCLCASAGMSSFSLDKACQSHASVSATRLWHVKWHQSKGMLSRSQTLNKKTELNMQAKPRPEWQQELWPNTRRSPSANHEASLEPSIWVLSPRGFEKLYKVWLLCEHDATTFKKPLSGKRQASKQNINAGSMSLGFKGTRLIKLMRTFWLLRGVLTLCLQRKRVFYGSVFRFKEQ